MNRVHTHRANPGVVTQRSVSLADVGAEKPAGAANSVFDQVRKPPPKQRDPIPRIDIDTLQIRKGVPLPAVTSGKSGASRYADVLARMNPGDSIELQPRQAYSIVAYAKKTGIKVAIRKLSDTATGVWRL